MLDSEFDGLLGPLLGRVAKLVYDLQASQHHHHSYQFGLLLHSLEVCNSCARSAGGLEFLGSETPEMRKANGQKWILAAGVAGLCHDLGKIVSDLVVRDESGIAWNPFLQDLIDFKSQHPSAVCVYRESRKHKDHEYYSLVLASNILTVELQSYLGLGDKRIIPAIFMAISGVSYADVPLFTEVVKKSDLSSTKKAMIKIGGVATSNVNSEAGPELLMGELEQEQRPPHNLVNATKAAFLRLIQRGEYLVNVKDREKGLFWLDGESLWVTWPRGFQALENVFEGDGFASYPKQAGVFLSALTSDNFAEERDGSRTWSANISGDSLKIKLTLAKLLDPDLLSAAKGMMTASISIKPVGFDVEKELAAGIAGKTNNATTQPSISNTHENSIDALVIKVEKPEKSEVSNSLAVSSASLDDYAFSDDFTDYCDNLDDAGDIIFNIALSILKGASAWFKSDDGLIFLEWPKFSENLGDDAVDIVSLLKSKRLLSTSGNKLRFNSDSTCLYQNGDKQVISLVISKLASSVLSGEISLFPKVDIQNTKKESSKGKKTSKDVEKDMSVTEDSPDSVKEVNVPSSHSSFCDTRTPEDTLNLFDDYVAQKMTIFRKDIEYVEELDCLGFLSMTSIFHAMIRDDLLVQSDRGVIYSFMSDGYIKVGRSYFKTNILKKVWKEFNIEN